MSLNKSFAKSIWDQKGPLAESGIPSPNGNDVLEYATNLLSDTNFKHLRVKDFNMPTTALRVGEEVDESTKLRRLREKRAADNKEKAPSKDPEMLVIVKLEEEKHQESGRQGMGSSGECRFLDPVQSMEEDKPVAESTEKHQARMRIFGLIAACLKEHHTHLVRSVVRGDVHSLIKAVLHLTQGHTSRAHLAACREMLSLRTSKDAPWSVVSERYIRINNCLATNTKTVQELLLDALFETMEGDTHFELTLQSLRNESQVTLEEAVTKLSQRAFATRTAPLPDPAMARKSLALQGFAARVSESRECYAFRDDGVCNYKGCRFEPCCSRGNKAVKAKCFHCHGAHHYKKCADLAKIFNAGTDTLGAMVAQQQEEGLTWETGEQSE